LPWIAATVTLGWGVPGVGGTSPASGPAASAATAASAGIAGLPTSAERCTTSRRTNSPAASPASTAA
jgi:hypothetical protein